MVATQKSFLTFHHSIIKRKKKHKKKGSSLLGGMWVWATSSGSRIPYGVVLGIIQQLVGVMVQTKDSFLMGFACCMPVSVATLLPFDFLGFRVLV